MDEVKKKKILIVEDEVGLLKILTDKLSTLNVDIIQAKTGQDALNLIQSLRPNLILLDIMLPGGMNGLDVLERMKTNPALRLMPVIILTNLGTEQKKAMELGAVDYIIKSNISLEQIILKVGTYLQ